MKRLVILVIIMFYTSSAAYGEKVQVKMRSSEDSGTLRLVFEADDATIKDAKVFHSYTLVKIEFQSEFLFDYEKTPSAVEISHKGSSLFVTIDGLKDIKVFRLSGPPRLVIDAAVEKSAEEESQPETPEKISGLSGLVMVLDPGHGGYNIGLVGGDYKEKDVVLSITKSLRHAAKEAGAKVFLTRYTDKYVTINERIVNTYERYPKVFLSLHLSSSPDFVIYYAKMDTETAVQDRYLLKYRQSLHVSSSSKFAKTVARVLKDRFKRNVVVRRMSLPILSSIDASALYIELPDGKYFDYNSSKRYEIVNALLKGIEEYER
ncbi:MAG: N-acetylmuramoyl-L-alanine amidase [Thermodesulfovibrionales bacterium]